MFFAVVIAKVAIKSLNSYNKSTGSDVIIYFNCYIILCYATIEYNNHATSLKCSFIMNAKVTHCLYLSI